MNNKTTWQQILSSKTGGFYLLSEYERNIDIFREHILQNSKNTLVKTIRGSMCLTKESLFKEFSTILEFPSYFGNNWDAFDDCLQDLSWLPANRYVFFIADIDKVLYNNPKDLHIFLDLLKVAVAKWNKDNKFRPIKAACPLNFVILSKPYTHDGLSKKVLEQEDIQISFIQDLRFFITGETDHTVGEKIRLAMIQIQKEVSKFLIDKDYGEGVNDWGYIIICFTPETYDAGFFKERKYYSKKNRDLDIRLQVDYDKMLKADEKETLQLICKSILRSVDVAENELKIGRNPIHIKSFDFKSYREDLTQLFNKRSWI